MTCAASPSADSPTGDSRYRGGADNSRTPCWATTAASGRFPAAPPRSRKRSSAAAWGARPDLVFYDVRAADSRHEDETEKLEAGGLRQICVG